MWIVILGCGSIGRRHLGKLKGLGSSELLAYDPAVLARRMTKEEIGLPKNPISKGMATLQLALFRAPSSRCWSRRIHQVEPWLASVTDTATHLRPPASLNPGGPNTSGRSVSALFQRRLEVTIQAPHESSLYSKRKGGHDLGGP